MARNGCVWGDAVASSGLVSAEMQGGIRVLWLLAPPGNLFGPALCAALHSALQAALMDADVQGVVIASGLRNAGQGFSGGINLADLGKQWPVGAPGPGDIARQIIQASRPVIAALHGPALGAGAEIALAAQGRVATPDLRFGLRDLLVGRLPMAGATQNLPRLIGATEALRLIGKGISVSAAEAVAMGIVDSVTEGDVVAAACAMALDPPPLGRSPGLRDGKAYQLAIAQARSLAQSGDGPDSAMTALIDCVEAAQLLPLAQGLDYEAEAAEAIAARPEAAALQHLMAAEMRMVVDLTGGRPVERMGLWGSATAPLILPALQAGMHVVLADDDRTALLQAVEKVARAQEELVVAGRLTAAARDAQWARLRPSVALESLSDFPLVIAAKPGAKGMVLQFGASGGDAPRLVLVAPGFGELQMAPGGIAFGQMAAATLRHMRLRLAISQSPPAGGVARAVVLAAQAACKAMMQMGVSWDDIAQSLQGVVRMTVSAQVSPAPERQGPPLSQGDIRARLLGAVAAEGARLLAQGAMRRGGALDALAAVALGMPRHLGGPLFAADQRGLLVLRRDLHLWQQDDPVWTPHPMLDQLVSAGNPLSGFDADHRG